MKYLSIAIVVSALVLGASGIAHAATKKMQVSDSITSKINDSYFYEKISDPASNTVCYSFIATHEGVAISCVKATN